MFNKRSKDLIAKGKSSISVFTKTLADLTKTNEAIMVEDARLEDIQLQMQAERIAMAKQSAINTRVAGKLEEILGLNGTSETEVVDLLDSETFWKL